MPDRRSYRRLMQLPAYGLYDSDGVIVASVRVGTALEARDLFRRHGLRGERVRAIREKCLA